MIIFDLINIKKIRRATLYAVCLLAALTLQNSFLSQFELLGAKAMLVPALIVAIGLFENGLWGGVFGLVAGVSCDMSSLGTSAMFTVVFTAIGFFSGMLAALLINRRFYSYMILAAAALLITPLFQLLPLWIYRGAELGRLAETGLFQALWSLPFAVPSYFACKAIAGREGTK